MCLEHLHFGSKNVIDTLVKKADEEGYIWLWKVFEVKLDDTLVAQFHDYSFYEGKNTARGRIAKELDGDKAVVQYTPGFHCCINKIDARWWKKVSRDNHREKIIVPIKVKKEWITAVGYQGGIVIVCKHIII